MPRAIINQIAVLLRTSEEEAEAYCEEVRRLSGKGAMLSYETIALCLSLRPRHPRPAIELAVRLRGAPSDGRHRRRHHDESTVYQPAQKTQFECCPHGVEWPKICAICEPDKFKEMTGMD